MNYKNFFLTNNSSGWKTVEKKLYNIKPDLCNLILNYCDNNDLIKLPFKQKIWHFINNINYLPKCSECNDDLKFKRSLNEGYGKYCSITCTNKNKEHINKIKITNNKIYGGNTPFSSDIIKEKSKNTMLITYGVDNPMKMDSVKEIFKNGSLKKYGTEYPSQSKKTKIRVENKDKYNKINILDNNNGLYKIKCDKCNNESDFNNNEINYRLNNDIPVCKNCYKTNTGISYPETELRDFIKSFNIDIIENDRINLNGQEIDIFIPTHNLGIEYNGLYWHSNSFKEKNYHLNKTNISNSKGIKLIQIFEDEWDYKKDIVKSRLLNMLKLNNNSFYARKCNVVEIDTPTKTKFLNENHIQGSIGSNINIGLYYEGILVSLMTFGKKRKSLGNVTNNLNHYELIRFCNKLNTSVIGGASKLLNHFIKMYNPTEIISYADKRWSNGDLYKKLGFNEIRHSNPNYFYIINKKRYNRFKFRKDRLVNEGFNKNKTEFQIMEERGIPIIYDSGNIVYIKTF